MNSAMPRNKLLGVRFTPEELALLDRLVAHFASTHPGVRFNPQMAIKAAIAIVAREAGVEGNDSPPKPLVARAKTRKR